MRRLAGWWTRRNPLLRFGVRFCLFFGAAEAWTLTPWCDNSISFLLASYAKMTNWVLLALGQHSQAVGAEIQGPAVSLTIKRGCDALDPLMVFCAGVLAYQAPRKQRSIGLLVGIILIVLTNLARILCLYGIQLRAPALFTIFHIYIWPVVFLLLVGFLWLRWVRWAASQRPAS